MTRENDKWKVLLERDISKYLKKSQVEVEHDSFISSALYDILFVCNGHYFEPRIPLDYSRFKGKLKLRRRKMKCITLSIGRVLHSHSYKRASDFYGQKVLIIGAGPSGVDIAVQLASQNTKVIIIIMPAQLKLVCVSSKFRCTS